LSHHFLNWRCQANGLIEVGLFPILLIGTGKTPIRPEIGSRRVQVKTQTLADSNEAAGAADAFACGEASRN
jgi:hypothetical protein